MKPRMNARGDVFCRMCDRYLPRDAFSKRQDGYANGFHTYCRKCSNERARRWRRTTDKIEQFDAQMRRASARRAVKMRRASEERVTFCAEIIRLLQLRGLNYKGIGGIAGLQPSVISRIARGRNVYVKKPTIEKLSYALIVTGERPRSAP